MAQDIATIYRELYRARFREEVSAGTKEPFILPLHLLGVWFLPTLYLAFPHKNRPWLYRARWLVLAIVVGFNFNMILNVSSHNFGSAYAVGLMASWGIIWNFTLLVWTRPQWEAKRVEIRRKEKQDAMENGQNGKTNGSTLTSIRENGHTTKPNGAQQNGNSAKNGSTKESDFARFSGPELRVEAINSIQMRRKRSTATDVPGVSSRTTGRSRAISLASLTSLQLPTDQEVEYYWQEYPEDESFWVRLGWAFDIVSTFRMTGWNWAISCLPKYEVPPTIRDQQMPLSSVGPQRSNQGYTRSVSRREFFLKRFFLHVVPSYLIVDLCSVYMITDPYFIQGPEHTIPLPPHLASLPRPVLSAQRVAFSFIAVVSALQLCLSAGALALAFLPPLPQILGFRAHPWHLPSATGSFDQVLDRGLAGFWGAWWHQTFRFGFAAPAAYLLREGYVKPGTPRARFSAAFFAFLQSGFLHGSASYSTVPKGTKWWLPPLFFFLAGAGTVLQGWLARAPGLKQFIARMPRWVRRAGNLLFVFFWMWGTSWTLVDDFGRCGLWLYEPVPISIARALGIGPTTDRRVWRLERDFWPTWYWGGKNWWDMGIGI